MVRRSFSDVSLRSEGTSPWLLLVLLGLLNLLLHLVTNGLWGFHRDELLYLALGRHLDWGFWSNPPLIGFFGWLAHLAPEASPWAVRLIPALVSTAMVMLTGLMAREMGGGRAAVVMACLCMLLSAFLRVGLLFQPVVFDVFFWTLYAFLILRYLNTEQPRWLWALGLAIGLGLLNKYSVAVFVFGVLLVLPFTPQRRLFTQKTFYGSVLLALVVFLPNLLWQARHGFPVLHHMQELHDTQLVHVRPLNFLLDQLFFHFPVAVVWVLGLVFLFSKHGKPSRLLGWIFAAVILLFLVLGGKSYYTLGLYPMLFAGGACWLEVHARRWIQVIVFAVGTIAAALLSPFMIPYLPVPAMVAYGHAFVETTGIDAPLRWEDGNVYPLPQDYADMLGWEELAHLVEKAYLAAPDPGRTLVYCENYGHAGAATHFLQKEGLPEPVSFSDSFRLWAPRRLPPDANTLIYVNDELGEDIKALFSDIERIGSVQTPYAREQGTAVYLCRNPRTSLPDFWRARLLEVTGGF